MIPRGRTAGLALALVALAGPARAAGRPEEAGRAEEAAYGNRERITATGVIRLVGNEPFDRVAITTDRGISLYLPPELDRVLRRRQGDRVTVTGRVRLERMSSADGKYRILEYHLEDVILEE